MKSTNKITTKKISSIIVTILILIVIALYEFLPVNTGTQNKNEQYSQTTVSQVNESTINNSDIHFRNSKLLQEHYEKHGIDMGFSSAKEYEKAAIAVVSNPQSLHKLEKEDGDDVYYLEKTNEFVIVSTDGYIRTYFKPDKGIKYYNEQ